MECSVHLLLLLLSISSEIISLASSSDSALYLSSYLKKNETFEARNLSEVNPELFLNVKSYSGFLTVDEKYNSNLFFWYFPARSPNLKNNASVPWMLWLQGGPGATSLYGLFEELGPFKWKNDNLQERHNSWNKEFSILFIDNPIGSGFSFTNDFRGIPSGLNESTQHLVSALDQFLQMFPELRAAPFYIAGESFAGYFAPALGQKIMDTEMKINLQGLIMGSPVFNHNDIANYTFLYYHWGLIDDQGVIKAKPSQDAYYQALKSKNAREAQTKKDELLDQLEALSFQHNSYNALVDTEPDKSFVDFIRRREIQDALHVGRIRFTFHNTTRLWTEFLTDMVPAVEKLLNRYRILIYCGQADMVAPCVASAEARRWWKWNAVDEFLNARRQPWWHGRKLAGYFKSGGDLTEVLVRNAGHLAPVERPQEVLELVTSFVFSRPISTISYDLPDDVTTEQPARSTSTEKTSIKPEAVGAGTVGAGTIVSISINVILIAAIVIVILLYWRKRRRSEDFYYSESSLSDGILTMS